jgi:hypothetical protein
MPEQRAVGHEIGDGAIEQARREAVEPGAHRHDLRHDGGRQDGIGKPQTGKERLGERPEIATVLPCDRLASAVRGGPA